MNETKYIIYKITNLINEKIYIGCHKCEDINDDYMGSGTLLKRAKEKYGIENFSKEILEVYNTSEEMFNMESQLVNEEFISRDDVYNIKLGGEGGWDYINDHNLCNTFNRELNLILGERGRQSQKILSETDNEWVKQRSENLSVSSKKYFEDGGINGFAGKVHSDEAKKKIGEANSKHQKGEGNSQFGKVWIYSLDLKESKKIERDKLPEYLDLGWLKGRKMKF